MELKLTVEPIPHSCTRHTLHNRIQARAWEKLVKKLDKRQEKRCGICGKKCSKRSSLIVQEEWDYTDLSRHQHLKGLIGLCHMCHLTKNIEQARLQQLRGDLDMRAIEAHFCRVNACTPEVFRIHVAQALRKLHIRNRQKHWVTDLGDYSHLVDSPPPNQRPASGETTAKVRHRRGRPSLVVAAIKRTEKRTERVHRSRKEMKAW